MTDKDFDVGPYLTRIEHEFPDLRSAAFRVPTQGLDHVAIILNEEWVFRFPKLPEYIGLFPKEIALLDELHSRITLRIPSYTRIASDMTFGGYRMIRGRELFPEVFDPLPAGTKDYIAAELARFLTELHAFPLDEAIRLGVNESKGRAYWSGRQREDYDLYLAKTLSEEDRAKCERHYAEVASHALPRSPVLTHGDFAWWHILLGDDRDRLAGVIDFGDRSIADPANDFGALFVYGADFVKAVYERYQGPKDPDFLRRARQGLTYVAISEMIHGERRTFGTREAALPVFRRAMDLPLDV